MNDLVKGLNIYLIGMMGVGKTTIGKQLAQQLNYRFLDTDSIIEQLTKKSINNIFEEEGENYFREIETQVLAETSNYIKSVIATGGGVVLNPHNWSYLHYGLIIWLDAPTELLVKRLKQDQTRPLLKDTDMTEKLQTIFEQRKNLYQQADLHIILSEDKNDKIIVQEIIKQIPDKIK